MSRPKRLCEHSIQFYSCKVCRAAYDVAYQEKRQQEYYEWLESIGCECCGFKHRYAIELHHLATEYKRYGRSQSHIQNKQDYNSGFGILLCGNCHNIFHGIFGGKSNPFPKMTKEETISLIKKEGNPK